MRTILHHPAFQALEAIWRGVHGLVADLDDDGARVFLLDVTQQELLLDLRAAGGKPQATGLHTLLIERGARMPDGEPWTLLIGDYVKHVTATWAIEASGTPPYNPTVYTPGGHTPY